MNYYTCIGPVILIISYFLPFISGKLNQCHAMLLTAFAHCAIDTLYFIRQRRYSCLQPSILFVVSSLPNGSSIEPDTSSTSTISAAPPAGSFMAGDPVSACAVIPVSAHLKPTQVSKTMRPVSLKVLVSSLYPLLHSLNTFIIQENKVLCTLTKRLVFSD